jgi:hypothetical protein
MSDTYRFCVKALAVEAAIIIAAGLIAGFVYDDWRAIIGAQAVIAGSEWIGYRIEGWLHRRRVLTGR